MHEIIKKAGFFLSTTSTFFLPEPKKAFIPTNLSGITLISQTIFLFLNKII